MQKHSLLKQCKKVFFVLLLLLSHSLLIHAGGIYAGADRAVCLNGSTSIGLSSPNSNLCFKWSGAGINGSNDQSPIISKLTTSQVYSVTVTNKDGNIVAQEQVSVFVFDLTTVVNKPRVLGSGSFSSNDLAMTFENIDNDDNDFMFDFKDTDGVLGGDDELFEIVTTIKWIGTTPTTKFPMNIAALKGGEDIDIWEKNDKTNHLQFNTPIIPNSVNSFSFWVEGLKAHSIAKSTELSISLHNNSGACKKNVSITIVGVQSMTWEGYGNGDKSLTNNVLANSPKTNAQIVFPDARFEGASVGAKRDKVKLKILLTCLPPVDFKMYMRALDIDDMTAGTKALWSMQSVNADTQNLLDPNDSDSAAGIYSGTSISYDPENDNRGSFPLLVGGKYGRWNSPLSPDNSLSMVSFAANQSEASNDFYVSQHPGDNYQIGAYPDLDFVAGFVEIDKIHNFIRYKNMPTFGAIGAVNGNYTSNKLEVWRLLHLEFDEMMDYILSDKQQLGESSIKDFTSATMFGSQITSVKLTQPINVVQNDPVLGTYPDASLDASTGHHGRFENGSIYIGRTAAGLPANLPLLNVVNRNSKNEIFFNANITIVPVSCEFTNLSATATSNGTITQILKTPTGFTLTIQGVPNLIDFNLGTIKIGLSPTAITINNVNVGNSTIDVKAIVIPIFLRDDDRNPGYLSTVHLTLNGINSAFSEAFIKPILDGGGNIANNTTSIPFISNFFNLAHINHINTNFFQSNGIESNAFWCSYVIKAWQPSTSLDYDSSDEGCHWADTDGGNNHNVTLSKGGSMSWMNTELFQDRVPVFGFSTAIAHEIGHQFGLDHGDATGTGPTIPENPVIGLMGDGDNVLNNPISPILFIPRHLNLIRCRVNSPGQ